MTTFYLVRHAHAVWTPDEDRRLSPQGFRDTVELTFALGRYPVTMICTSPYLRARHTVGPLSLWLGLAVQMEPDLRERELGAFADGDFLQAVEATWRDPSFAHPGGESNHDAQERGVAVVQRLQSQNPDGHIVLSTHGNLMALILQWYDRSIDFAFWRSLSMPDVYELRLLGEIGISMRRLRDVV